jgi:hypothetical protein
MEPKFEERDMEVKGKERQVRNVQKKRYAASAQNR